MANFVDFICETAKDHALGKELLSNLESMDAKSLQEWFTVKKGYDVSLADCTILLAKKADIQTTMAPHVKGNY
jgi:hypothetical protein